MLEIHLLGKFAVTAEGRQVDLPLRAAQSLLAYLALTAGTPHRREQLAGLLWPDADEASAKGNLRHTLWRVRKALGSHEVILADDLTLMWDPAADYWLDAQLVAQKLPADASAEDLMAAVSAYGGELLPGFYDDWVVLERERLQAAFEHKMGALLERLQAGQRWPEMLEWGERWIALGHTPEAAYRALITAHGSRGDAAGAAAAYRRCFDALQADLGVEPSAQTRALAQAAPLLSAQLRPTPKTNLPSALSSFIGREKEIAEIRKRLADYRLVTLTGSGGIGKTRLSLQAATELQGEYLDGVWLVELAPLADPALVPQAIATTLDTMPQGDTPLLTVLSNYLRAKTLLLVLDNCEHLIAACAQLANLLLSTCPGLRILASSREALGLEGENAYRVPSLSLPDPHGDIQSVGEAEAVRLFVARAAAVLPGFALTEANASAIAQVCRRLDGIALALELAAARVKLLKVEQIVTRLDDAFHLLTGGSRAALPRQQTLRATVDWSHNLLAEDERALLRRLSVFVGGWTLEAAEAVCAAPGEGLDVLDVLSHLVDKSLVVAEREQGKKARYHLPETIRLYAREKLAEGSEEPALRDRHLLYLVEWMEQASPHLHGPDLKNWLACCETDIDNLRAALEWGLHNDRVAGLRLALATYGYWYIRADSLQLQHWLAAYLDQPDAVYPTTLHAEALARLAAEVSDLAKARRFAEQSLDLAPEDIGVLALANFELACIAFGQGEFAESGKFMDLAERLAQEKGDLWLQSRICTQRGKQAWFHEDLKSAQTCFLELLRIGLTLDSPRIAAWAKVWAGGIVLWTDGPNAAHCVLEEGATTLRDFGLQPLHFGLGWMAVQQGNFAIAETEFRGLAAAFRDENDPVGQALGLANLAFIALVQGYDERALALLVEARPVLEQAAVISRQVRRAITSASVMAARIYIWLGDCAQGQYWLDQEPTINSSDDKAKFALARGELALRQDRLTQATESLRQSLQFHRGSQERLNAVEVVETQAELLCRLGQPEQATHLFGAAAAFRAHAGMLQYPRFKPHFDGVLAELKEKLGEVAFAEAWAEGEALGLDRAVESVLQEGISEKTP